MTRLPPLDMHAHIDVAIDEEEVDSVGCVVFAVTRSLEEAEQALLRTDRQGIWGVGCHPGLASALNGFSQTRFAALVERTAFAGELGLDGKARSSKENQVRVLREALDVLTNSPRIVSLHSYGATSEVLDAIEGSGVPNPILHWWLGDGDETSRAVDLGCYFSVNNSGLRRTDVLDAVPIARLLTETDHPFGDRRGATPRPGNVARVEEVLSRHHAVSQPELRRILWRNLASLVRANGCGALLPRRVRSHITAAGAAIATD